MEILKVYVPPARREQGIAAVLTERALAYAHENDLEVIPTCSYVRWYMEREQEEANVDR